MLVIVVHLTSLSSGKADLEFKPGTLARCRKVCHLYNGSKLMCGESATNIDIGVVMAQIRVWGQHIDIYTGKWIWRQVGT